MSKETNLKEKLRQALVSTIRVISDDFAINVKSEKNKSSNNPSVIDIKLILFLKYSAGATIAPQIALESEVRRMKYGKQ